MIRNMVLSAFDEGNDVTGGNTVGISVLMSALATPFDRRTEEELGISLAVRIGKEFEEGGRDSVDRMTRRKKRKTTTRRTW